MLVGGMEGAIFVIVTFTQCVGKLPTFCYMQGENVVETSGKHKATNTPVLILLWFLSLIMIRYHAM
jgi:hypothetical protein